MKIAASVLSVLVVGINIFFVVSYVRDTLPAVWWVDLLLSFYGLAYVGFICYLTLLLYGAMGGPGFDRVRVRRVARGGRGKGEAGIAALWESLLSSGIRELDIRTCNDNEFAIDT